MPVPFLTHGANLRFSRSHIILQLQSCCCLWGTSCSSFHPPVLSLRVAPCSLAGIKPPVLPVPAEHQAGVVLGKGTHVQVWPPKSTAEIKSPSKVMSCCLDPLSPTDPKFFFGLEGEMWHPLILMDLSFYTCSEPGAKLIP